MQHTDLFMELAGIAGIFVGFGALIAVRSGGPSEPGEVAPMRGIVGSGVLAVMGSLAPVTLSFFDLAEHEILALSSGLFLLGEAVFVFVVLRSPEYRAMAAGEMQAARTPSAGRWLLVFQEVVLNGLLMLAMLAIPIVIVLGVAPDLEAGLYFALIALTLFGAAWLLLWLAFKQHLPERA